MGAAKAIAPIELCSWKDCTEPASHNFRWEWGEEGKVCPKCIPLMQQTAGNLGRNVTFVALDQSPPSLTISERSALMAAKLSAEQELKQVQLAGHELYRQNVDLTQQVQTHVLKARERDALLARKDQEIQELAERLETRERDLGEASAELQRLRVLVPFAEETSRVG